MKSSTWFVVSGSLLGAVVGFLVFAWLVKTFGAYGFAIPGVAVGLGASAKSGAPAWAAFFSGVVGLVAGIFATWKMAPFRADGSLGYFFAHLHQLPSYQQILIVLGAAIALWLPWRRRAR